MTEQQIFEQYGRKQVQLEQCLSDYTKTVAVLRGLKNGTLALKQLTVNDDGTWSLAPNEQVAAKGE